MFVRMIQMNSSCGVSFTFRLRDFKHGHLFVRFKSEARVLTSEGYKNASPGDFIFYRADEEMAYGSGDWRFVHDYFRFFAEEDEISLLTFPTSTLYKAPISQKMEQLLEMMTREFYSNNASREASLSLLGKLFLFASRDHLTAKDGVPIGAGGGELVTLRARMLSSPEKNWTVELLAEEARLSPSYFQVAYKKAFGISPINDLIEARIKKAESYLLSTDKKEIEIARLSGYGNVEHFIRQFRRLRRVTPSELRRMAKK